MSHLREFYHVEQLPVFQNRMFATPEEAKNCVKGDVILVQDLQTGLIFNKAFQPQLMQYDVDYQNEQAVSSIFRSHLQDVSEIILKHFHNCTLLEVGCGKGYFLEHLQRLSFEITGIDPIYTGANSSILKKYFSSDLGLRADGIILRHVLEHVQYPVDFLVNICESNGGIGKIYIEVPCFDWICQHRAWFDIFYEHVNYFRIGNFSRIFGRIYESGHIFNGQYLYVVADLATLQKPNCDDSDDFEFPNDLLDSVYRYAHRLIAHRTSQRASAIWGGASKGVIFALFMQRAGTEVDFVIDINPAKQGKYLASTGLRVYSPEDAISQLEIGADIFVMNGNYLHEIEKLTNSNFNLFVVDYENIFE